MTATPERRRWARIRPVGCEPDARVRLRAGGELRVQDRSANGIRLRGGARLLPGLHVDLHVAAEDGRRLVRARVVWSVVAGLEPLEYLSAVQLESPVRWWSGG